MNWSGITQKVLIPAVAAPVIAGVVAACGTWLVYRITRKVVKKRREEGFRWGQIATASLVALSHGTNDAQKTMGVIALALITTGHLTGDIKNDGLPFWIVASCALAIGLGTYIGGWRVIRTLGKGLVEIESPQGLAAEASSAAIILSSSAAGMALSTTHVATGSILGSGVGKPGAEVRWAVAGRMAVAWLLTLPAAGLVGAVTFWISHGIAGFSSALAGDIVIFGILVRLLVLHMVARPAAEGRPHQRQRRVGHQYQLGGARRACARREKSRKRPSPKNRSPEGLADELSRKHPAGAHRRTDPRCGPALRSSRSDWWRSRTAPEQPTPTEPCTTRTRP